MTPLDFPRRPPRSTRSSDVRAHVAEGLARLAVGATLDCQIHDDGRDERQEGSEEATDIRELRESSTQNYRENRPERDRG